MKNILIIGFALCMVAGFAWAQGAPNPPSNYPTAVNPSGTEEIMLDAGPYTSGADDRGIVKLPLSYFQKSIGGGVTHTIAKGTFTLPATSLAAYSCGSVTSIAASGVSFNDVVNCSPNTDPTVGWGSFGDSEGIVCVVHAYPTTGYVNFRVCNTTANPGSPPNLTYNWQVLR